jgi:hypothetical protein
VVCWSAHTCVCAMGGAAGGSGRFWHHRAPAACQVSTPGTAAVCVELLVHNDVHDALLQISNCWV